MVRTLWVWIVGILMTILCGTLIVFFSFLDPGGKTLHLFAKLWARTIIAAAGVRVNVRGKENLPADTSMIVASNHQGYFDIFVLMAYIPLHLGWIAKKELYRIPVFSFAMRRYGNIMIDRSNRERARSSLATAADRIRRGQSVLIFPEGTRSPDGKVHAFKKGCYYLAKASEAPIVPVSISGSFAVMPKKTFRLHPGSIHVVIGTPVYVHASADSNRDGFLKHLRQMIIDNQVR